MYKRQELDRFRSRNTLQLARGFTYIQRTEWSIHRQTYRISLSPDILQTGEITLVIRQQGAGTAVSFSSREGQNPPSLELRYSGCP